MNLQDKPIDQVKDVAAFLNKTVQPTNPPSETQWNEIRYDLGNIAMFLEAFTIPAMEAPIVRHEYKTVARPAMNGRPIAVFGRDEETSG